MYIGLFVFLFLISLISVESRYLKIVALVLTFILVVFAGTRLEIAPDYQMYYYGFYDAVKYEFFLRDQPTFEYCMYVIPNLVFLFFKNYFVQVSFIVFAVLGVSSKMIVIKKADFFILSFFLYFTNLYFIQEMITIRAGIASGIFFLSIKDLENEDDRSFFLKFFIALLFHYSSIIFLLVWFCLRFNIKYYITGLCLSFVFIFFKLNILTLLFLDRLFPKVQIYLDILESEGQEDINLFNFRIIFAILVSVFFFISYNKLEEKKLFVVLFKTHLISLILFFILSTTAITFSLRAYELLSVVQILLYPMTLLLLQGSYKYIGYGVIFCFCFVQFFYMTESSKLFIDYNSWIF